MIRLLLDTHAAIFLLHADSRLPRRLTRTIELIGDRGDQIAVSSISLVEAMYLEEKGRVPLGTWRGLMNLLQETPTSLVEIPVTSDLIEFIEAIPRNSIPDMPDRVIAATAVLFGIPLASRDGKIRASQVETIW